MDEPEVSEDSSKEISNKKSLTDDEIASSSPEVEFSDSDPGEKQEKGMSISPEDLPTMHWSDVYAELAEFENEGGSGSRNETSPPPDQQPPPQTGPVKGLEDAMTWLEQLASGQGIPIDEMPTLVTNQSVPGGASQRSGDLDPPSDGGPAAQDLELDSDPMAWLEQLAVDQSSPIEELPSVADRLLASEIVSQNDIPPGSTINDPYEIDRALTYLEQLAVAQGVDLNKVSFDANQPVDSLDAALAIIDRLALVGLAVTSDASEPESLLVDNAVIQPAKQEGDPEEAPGVDYWSDMSSSMPDDPQEALDWLESIEDEQDAGLMELKVERDKKASEAVTSGPDGSTDSVENEVAANEEEIGIDVLQEMPEDPDEAIAWMKDLAARDSQGPSARQEEMETPANPEPVSLEPEAPVKSKAASTGIDLENTISDYQKKIEDEAITKEEVAALENIVESQGETPKLLRLLGDAYMQIGETEKAIATYRKGFDHF